MKILLASLMIIGGLLLIGCLTEIRVPLTLIGVFLVVGGMAWLIPEL